MAAFGENWRHFDHHFHQLKDSKTWSDLYPTMANIQLIKKTFKKAAFGENLRHFGHHFHQLQDSKTFVKTYKKQEIKNFFNTRMSFFITFYPKGKKNY